MGRAACSRTRCRRRGKRGRAYEYSHVPRPIRDMLQDILLTPFAGLSYETSCAEPGEASDTRWFSARTRQQQRLWPPGPSRSRLGVLNYLYIGRVDPPQTPHQILVEPLFAPARAVGHRHGADCQASCRAGHTGRPIYQLREAVARKRSGSGPEAVVRRSSKGVSARRLAGVAIVRSPARARTLRVPFSGCGRRADLN